MGKFNFNHKLLIAQSLSASFVSNSEFVDCNPLFSVQLHITGTPVGIFSLQVSNDLLNWITLENSGQAIISANDIMYNVKNSGWLAVRVAYAATSGDGTVDATVYGKDI